ncbi:MAG: SgcJ/EcaC family oxidoreductase [Alloalcanivorax venustensis]|uniref:YybH family protein n=3 Tax=Pseudomonadota TaxID=1224 RepID=UPI0032983367
MSTPHEDEQAIQTLIAQWARAVSAGDLDGILACYAEDVEAYDAIGRLRFQGLEAYGAHWRECMAYCNNGMVFDVHEPRVRVDGDLAVSYFPVRCGGENDKGKEQVGWMRMSSAYQRLNGQWKIVHEHSSVPFDPMTLKIMEDAAP